MAPTPPSRSPSRRFDFRFAPAYRLAALPLGITPRTTQVRVGDGLLSVRFGPCQTTTRAPSRAAPSIARSNKATASSARRA